MALLIRTQPQLRAIQSLPFCYLCGRPLVTNPPEALNMDHVPPKKLFRVADRNPPLQLPTHESCNNGHSENDAVAAQLIDVMHGTAPTQQRFEAGAGTFADGSPGLAVRGFDMRALVRRWVRGFHAALYGEFVPDGPFTTITPLPEANLNDDGSVTFGPVADVAPHFVETLKKNRAVGALDTVICFNENCRYECVWVQADRGEWMCVWALDVYGWIRLGDGRHFEPRGCFGAYRRAQGGVPSGAAESTALSFPISNGERLDPFGS